MAKLTDAQLVVLSAAAARDDGVAVIAAKMNRAAASKVGASLVTRKLMREVRSKPGMPVWRQSEGGRPSTSWPRWDAPLRETKVLDYTLRTLPERSLLA